MCYLMKLNASPSVSRVAKIDRIIQCIIDRIDKYVYYQVMIEKQMQIANIWNKNSRRFSPLA